MSLPKYREQAKEYYHKLKADPERYRLYLLKKNKNTRAWYQRLKRNFPKYEALLKKQNERLRVYRASRSAKYLQSLARKRDRRVEDPFKHRGWKKRSYERMRKDPSRYQRYLERCRNWYHAVKNDPVRYREFLEGRMVYQRYRRIVKKAALQEAL